MPARKRSDVPMPGITHGPGGYARGCGCAECRKANAEGQQRHKEKIRAGNDSARATEKTAFKGRVLQETLTHAVIAKLGELSPEQEHLANLALMSAKLIDTIPETGKWHLMSTTVKTLRDVMKELKTLAGERPAPAPAEGGDGDDFAATLRQPGES